MLVSKDYPYIQVRVTVLGFSSPFRALLDTGFDGYLVLPENVGSQLGRPDYLTKTCLADGTERDSPEYRGSVEIVGLNVAYLARIILLGNECLVGQDIIKKLKVTFDRGSQILVEP